MGLVVGICCGAGRLMMINRRHFLQSAISASAAIAATSALAPRLRAFTGDSKRKFYPVKVSRSRLIREVVGLRPYRPEGFVVATEKIGDKLLVHNYGHGGAGITLSWGSAALAIEQARDSGQTQFAVLGCGVIGLSTARMLQRQGGTVTIYAKALPPQTTSNIAGGFWYPTSVFDTDKATPKFLEQFNSACRVAQRAFQLLAGPEYGVHWIETYQFLNGPEAAGQEMAGGNSLYADIHIHQDAKHYFGAPYVKQFTTLLIEPQTYLNALLRDFYIAGGKIVVMELKSRNAIQQLPEQVVFNCTGLGARALFADQSLIPVRGQLEILLPQPEIDYCYLSEAGYMFPRHDGIILGGTWDHDNWSLEPNPQQATEILDGHTEIMKRVK
jgi:glycine/D-amino acid oxidase-like deaminating enzyme